MSAQAVSCGISYPEPLRYSFADILGKVAITYLSDIGHILRPLRIHVFGRLSCYKAARGGGR